MRVKKSLLGRRIWGAGLALGLMTFGSLSCCPDATESCLTLAEWRARSCSNLPDAPSGLQCPTAETFAETCGTKLGPARVDGEKCCYTMPVSCY